MGRAAFMFAPTIYLEPLGGVVCEAMLTGTPVVTTDIGAFTENVQQGVTGFRCKTLAEFVSAGNKAASLDRSKIAAYATSRFSTEVVGAQFDEYFARLSTIRGEGWYT
jgi:glycosyltransferase involved in cell wall biosynthesis